MGVVNMGFDNWLMTDPRDYLPNVKEIFDSEATEEDLFDYVMEEDKDNFIVHLIEAEVIPEDDDKEKSEERVRELWEKGDPELLHYLVDYFDDYDNKEEFVMSRYGYMFD